MIDKRQRRQNFNFFEMGIKAGEELVAVSDSSIKVIVKDERKVTYKNKDYYLTGVNEKLGFPEDNVKSWLYKEKFLDTIYEETYPKEEEKMNTEFTWIPFYQEMAQKLLEYKDRRSELLNILYSNSNKNNISATMYVDNGPNGTTVPLTNIDPFTFMGCFNRGIKQQDRVNLGNSIAESLKMKLRLSKDEDFKSIPILNSQHSTLFFRNCPQEDYDKLWNLFEKAYFYTEDNQKDYADAFDLAVTVKGTSQKYATMVSYWVNPYKILAVDTNNVELLKKYGIIVPNKLTGKDYLELLNKTTSMIENNEIKEKSIPEFSYKAWLAKNILGEFSMTDINVKSESTFIDKYISLLKSNHNIILHGAPGTGKTFLAKEIAKAMGCTDNELGFVQFHPSYDYTDFVEGLRPINSVDGNSIGFERRDGVFKEFCKRAIDAIKDPEIVDNFDELWKKLVDKLDEVGVLDIPLLSGRGTFPIELNEYGTGLASRTYKTEKRDEWIQGKSKFFSKEQLNNIYKGIPGVPAEGHDNYRKAVVKYMKENFGLKDFSSTLDAESQKIKTTPQTKPFVFIIDEINRGEISKIFGELFFSIDPGYRGEKGRVQTQYQNLIDGGEFVNGFYVPENVYIIGTMNDIDRSVESMDFAMRRRFIFKEITAEESAINMNLSEEAICRMTNLNNAISEIEGLNSSYHIGGAYFLNDYGDRNVTDFEELWKLKLESLIKEYLRGMDNSVDNLVKLKQAYDKID